MPENWTRSSALAALAAYERLCRDGASLESWRSMRATLYGCAMREPAGSDNERRLLDRARDCAHRAQRLESQAIAKAVVP